MQALVLVGGEGTRLRPLTATIPKPVLPVAGVPFLSRMVAWLGSHGVDEVILACGFMPDRIREVLGDGGAGGPSLTYLHEPEPRGTAGAIKFAEPHLADRFLALNGDVLADLDLSALADFHSERGARATLSLYPVSDPSAYGVVRSDDRGQILEFLEKPANTGPAEINAGCYILEREIFEAIPADAEVSIEREVFAGLVGNGLYGLRLEGYWMDIGSPDRFLEANWDILEGRVAAEVGEGARPGEAVLVGPGSVIAEDARIGPRAVIGPGSRIGSGAVIRSSVLLEGCDIGEQASVEGAILGPRAAVAAGAEVAPGAILGEAEKVPGPDG
jgi:mannose-1-phosphate guanylyltransferase